MAGASGSWIEGQSQSEGQLFASGGKHGFGVRLILACYSSRVSTRFVVVGGARVYMCN